MDIEFQIVSGDKPDTNHSIDDETKIPEHLRMHDWPAEDIWSRNDDLPLIVESLFLVVYYPEGGNFPNG